MRIIAKSTLADYYTKNPGAKTALEDWYDKTKQTEWACFADIKKTFNSVDSVGNKRYVFNIKGNDYRLVVMILFTPKTVYIRYVGTRAEYEDIHYPISKPSLVDTIKLRLYEMGITQSKLAEMLGISPARVSEIMTGKCEPTLKVARAICQKLNISPDIVLGV